MMSEESECHPVVVDFSSTLSGVVIVAPSTMEGFAIEARCLTLDRCGVGDTLEEALEDLDEDVYHYLAKAAARGSVAIIPDKVVQRQLEEFRGDNPDSCEMERLLDREIGQWRIRIQLRVIVSDEELCSA